MNPKYKRGPLLVTKRETTAMAKALISAFESRAAAAARLGVDQSAFSRWLSRTATRRRMRHTTWLRAARLLAKNTMKGGATTKNRP